MQLTGFAISNGEVSTKDLLVNIAMNWDTSSNLIYEICIAKKDFFGPAYASVKNLGEITLNVEINGLKMPVMLNTAGMHNGVAERMVKVAECGGGGMDNGNSQGGDFNNAREQYAQTEQASGNVNHASLATKTCLRKVCIEQSNQ